MVAVGALRCERVGHGIQIHRSASAIEAVRASGAMLEVSVTSNWLTAAVPSVSQVRESPRATRAPLPTILPTAAHARFVGAEHPERRACAMMRACPSAPKPAYSPVSKSGQLSTCAPSLQPAAGSRSGIV
jgi:hypothetical protein